MQSERLEQVKDAVKDLYIGEDFGKLPLFYKKLFHIATAEGDKTEIVDERVKTVKEFGGDRDYILRYRLAGSQIESGLLLYEGKPTPGPSREGNTENFFLLMVQPPQQVKSDDIPPRDYVFIMDVSGSMRGFPIETSKTLLRNLLAGLRPQDSFNVLLFAGSSSLLSEQSLPANEENLSRALSLIDKQGGGGGTEILPALQRALDLPKAEGMARTIAIVTDGYVHVESETFDLIRNNLHHANIFPFGIGKSVNRFLLEGMAKIGQGEPFVITRPDKAAEQAERFRRYIESPVLTGIQLDFDGFEAYDVEPLSIPDVLAERPVIVYGKWRGKVQGTIDLKGFSGAGAYQQSFKVN
ncbi:MAG: VWA domain-containing protein, partial [bacterium]|nr:VWA domain-containing protein [bacterium]